MFKVGDRIRYECLETASKGGFITHDLIVTGIICEPASWDYGDGIFEYRVLLDDEFSQHPYSHEGKMYLRSNYMTLEN